MNVCKDVTQQRGGGVAAANVRLQQNEDARGLNFTYFQGHCVLEKKKKSVQI